MNPDSLRSALEYAWSSDTSASPDEWTPERPALGQCAVTALIVQDRLGGCLLRSTVGGVSHYFNMLPSGEVVDLTRDQFDDPTLDAPAEQRDRSYVLSYPATVERYNLLRRRMGDRP